MKYDINRRRFVQAGLMSLAATSSGVFANGFITGSPSIKANTFYKVLYDVNVDVTKGFAQAAQLSNQQIQSVSDDVSSLWFNDLSDHWRNNNRPAPVAGMTSQTTAYCLEVLARDAGLKMVFKAVHQPLFDGGFSHRLLSSTIDVEPMVGLSNDWAGDVYYLAANHQGLLSQRIPDFYPPGVSATQDDALVSWVLAAVEKTA